MMMNPWNIYNCIGAKRSSKICKDLAAAAHILHDMISRLDGDGMHPYLTTHSSRVPFAYKPSSARMAASPLAPRVSMCNQPKASMAGRRRPLPSSSQGQATCVLHSKALQKLKHKMHKIEEAPCIYRIIAETTRLCVCRSVW
jgi:hypothetical protein